ncbi:hypothetical protein BDV18DRAFT_158231 [Aspergillus unguis]
MAQQTQFTNMKTPAPPQFIDNGTLEDLLSEEGIAAFLASLTSLPLDPDPTPGYVHPLSSKEAFDAAVKAVPLVDPEQFWAMDTAKREMKMKKLQASTPIQKPLTLNTQVQVQNTTPKSEIPVIDLTADEEAPLGQISAKAKGKMPERVDADITAGRDSASALLDEWEGKCQKAVLMHELYLTTERAKELNTGRSGDKEDIPALLKRITALVTELRKAREAPCRAEERIVQLEIACRR